MRDAFRMPSARDTDDDAAGFERAGHRHLIDTTREPADDGPPLGDGMLRGLTRGEQRFVGCVAGADDAKSGPIEPFEWPADEQERRARRAESVPQRRGKAIVECRHQLDSAIGESLLLEHERGRGTQQRQQASRLVIGRVDELRDLVGVAVEEIAGIVASGQIPELASGERLRVERHESIGEEQRRANGVGGVLQLVASCR